MDSDTESESNASVTGVEQWDASDYGYLASTPAACASQGEGSVRVCLASEIKSAVEVLGSLNLEGVENVRYSYVIVPRGIMQLNASFVRMMRCRRLFKILPA